MPKQRAKSDLHGPVFSSPLKTALKTACRQSGRKNPDKQSRLTATLLCIILQPRFSENRTKENISNQNTNKPFILWPLFINVVISKKKTYLKNLSFTTFQQNYFFIKKNFSMCPNFRFKTGVFLAQTPNPPDTAVSRLKGNGVLQKTADATIQGGGRHLST